MRMSWGLSVATLCYGLPGHDPCGCSTATAAAACNQDQATTTQVQVLALIERGGGSSLQKLTLNFASHLHRL